MEQVVITELWFRFLRFISIDSPMGIVMFAFIVNSDITAFTIIVAIIIVLLVPP